jgi:hypothetical protein
MGDNIVLGRLLGARIDLPDSQCTGLQPAEPLRPKKIEER